MVQDKGYALGNVDATVIAQKPKLAAYIPLMCEKVAHACQAEVHQVNIKATTTETLGFVGRQEGIAAQAAVLLLKHSSRT